jgi:threonine/homoserine/homoserine lactone efflux protein
VRLTIPSLYPVGRRSDQRSAPSERQNRGVPGLDALVLFSLAALALLLVPGPAVLYVVVQSAEHGRMAGLASVAGIHVGTFVHTAAAAVGVSALVVSSAVAFTLVKYAGAAYLVYVGVRRLLAHEPAVRGGVRPEPLRRLFGRGVAVNLLNPKTALFFLAFLPQFVDPSRTVWTQVVAFGLLFVVLGFVTDGLYALAAGSVSGFLRRRRRALRYSSGSILVGLGAATAVTAKSS